MTVTIDGSASVTINSGAVLGLNSGTAVASTSGTSIDFTSIPSWVKRITVMFTGVSTNGTSQLMVQLGAGSVTSSGYTGNVARQASASNTYIAYSSGFLILETTAATYTTVGHLTITLINSNTWVCSGIAAPANSINNNNTTTGSVALGGTLDRVRITTSGGTDTFDAGTINILYE
jgi:hypothetical protein